MTSEKFLCCALLATVFLSGCAGASGRVKKAAAGVNVSKQKRDVAAINKWVSLIREEDLTPERLRKYSDENLEALYKTLCTASFYSPDENSYVLRQERVFNEKLHRAKYKENDVEKMISNLIEARMFDKAAVLKEQFPGVDTTDIPGNIVAGWSPPAARWQAYDVSENGKKAELKILNLDAGPKIVMVMFPGCAAMEAAVKDILADAELSALFRANGVMLTRRFDPAGVEEIKREHAFSAVYIARKSMDFPDFDLTFSPRMYFLKDGKAMYAFRGWSDDQGETSKKKIRQGLLAIGIKTEAQ